VTERDEWAEVRRKGVLCVLHAWRTGDAAALADVLADEVEAESLNILCQGPRCWLRGKPDVIHFIVAHGKERPGLELVDFLLGVGGVVALLRDHTGFCVWEFQADAAGKLSRLRIYLSAGHDFGVPEDCPACTRFPERYAECLRGRCGSDQPAPASCAPPTAGPSADL